MLLRSACIHCKCGVETEEELSFAEKQKMQQEKGNKGAAKRGVGLAGRMDFDLPTNWTTEEVPSTSKTSLYVISPGGKRHRSQRSAKAAIKERGMKLCFNESSEDSGSQDSVRVRRQPKENFK